MRTEPDDPLPPRFVLVVGMLFGLILVFLSPPFSAPDELAHLLRAYHCSQGKLYAMKILNAAGKETTGDYFPFSLIETYTAITHQATKDSEFAISWDRFDTAAAVPLDPARQDFFAFGNTAIYTPVPYAPQAVALWIARRFEMRPLYMIYAGRLANLIAYLCLAVAAVSIAPVQKWTLALVALMPMAVYLAAAMSADAVTIGLAMLVFAMTLDFATGAGRIGAWRLCRLGLLLVLLGLSKQAYLGMALLVFAIPADRFGSRLGHWAAKLLLIGVPAAVFAAWAYSVRGIYVPILDFVNPRAQSIWIVHHLGAYFTIVFKAMYRTDTYLIMIGIFGWLGRPLWRTTLQAYWATLFATAVLDGGRRARLGLVTRLIAFGTYIATAALMETLVYLSSEPVGRKYMQGIQPRYFIPIVPLLFLSVRGPDNLAANRWSRLAVRVAAIAMVLIGAGSTCWVLCKRYYFQIEFNPACP